MTDSAKKTSAKSTLADDIKNDSDMAAENKRLKAENDRLRQMVNDAAVVGGPTARPVPVEPSFGMSEGQRSEIESTGATTSPFTGARQTEADLPNGVEIHGDGNKPADSNK